MPSLRSDLHKTQVMLDGLATDSVVLDRSNLAWQFGGIYWYPAVTDSPCRSSFELAQLAPITVIHEAGAAVSHPKGGNENG